MGGGDLIEGRHRSTAICPRNTSRRKARYIEARASGRIEDPPCPTKSVAEVSVYRDKEYQSGTFG